jgi:hypothetical protein
MPKVNEPTRKDRAVLLRKRLQRGPHFSAIAITFTPDEAEKQFRIWAEHWIVPELDALVPELRKPR